MAEPAKQICLEDSSNIKEALKFEETTIFYNFLTDLGVQINPTEAARSLLKHDFALSAANYYSNDIEIAERFNDLLRLRNKAQDVYRFIDIVMQGNYAKIIKQVIKNPRIASEFFYRFIKIIINGSESIKKKEDAPQKIDDLSKFIDDSMVKIQWIEALERDIDRRILAPQYINEIPFVRVGLQPFFIILDKEKLGIDVEVLIHRTGIAILRFYITLKGQKTLDDIINFKTSSVSFECLEIAEELTEFMTTPLRHSTESHYSSGINWSKYEASGDIKGTLTDVFELYRDAIISVVQNKKLSKSDEPWSWLRSATWLAYPVIFIGNIIPSINNYEELKEKYPKELAGLILRYPNWPNLRDDIVKNVISSDLAITMDYSLFIEPSHSLIIYYKALRDRLAKRSNGKFPSPEWLSEYLNSSVVIEILLIQRWILNMLNDKAKAISLNLKSLVKMKRDLLLGLEEYDGIVLSYGSAQDIINQRKVNMGTVALYERLKHKIGTFESLIDIEESNKRAQLDLLLKSSAFFATALFGLVGSWSMVEIIAGWNKFVTIAPEEWNPLFISMINFVKNHQIAVSIFLYSIPIIVLMIIILYGIKHNSKEPILISDQSISARNSGFKWPVEIRIIHKK